MSGTPQVKWWVAIWRWITGGAGHREDFAAASSTWREIAVRHESEIRELKTETKLLRHECEQCKDDRTRLTILEEECKRDREHLTKRLNTLEATINSR